jgi:FG-GAP repeat
MKKSGTWIRFVVGGAMVLSAVCVFAEGESSDMPTGLWEAFSEARHAVEPTRGEEAKGFLAQSPANDLVFRFNENGLTVEPGVAGQDWSLTMTLSAWGQGDAMRPAGKAEVVREGRRIEYRRKDLTEWYTNHNRGLEQGFTLQKPEGYRPLEPVVLSLDLSGGLTPTILGNGTGVSFTISSGRQAFKYEGLTAFDADGVELPAELSMVRDRLEIRVEAGDSPWPITIDPVISTETKLQGAHDDAAVDDHFGYSVAIDGATAVIGSRDDDDAGGSSGSAYVFVRYGGAWVFQAKLTASDAAADDLFGSSVSVSGDTVLVGSPGDDDVAISSGSAYVYVRSGTDWSQQQKLTANDPEAGDLFGSAVSVSGDTAVVGAYLEDGFKGVNKGAAYVFFRSGTWSLQSKLTAADSADNDVFGCSVSVSGDTALVGAMWDDDGGDASGSAYVFFRTGSSWSQQQKLTASDAAADDIFGFSVSVSGDTALIGAPTDDDGGTDSGSAYPFLRTGTTWSQQAKLVAADDATGDHFGWSVSLSADTALIGAPSDDDAGSNSGSAYVFARAVTIWSQKAKLTASDAAAEDAFGWFVSLSGDVALVGAEYDDDGGSNSGSAYAFVRSGTTWSEHAKLVAVKTVADDRFGTCVSVSGDTALIGAPRDDDGGANSGAAYVFVRSGATWSRQAKLMASDAGANDEFGTGVSAFGDTALIGAYRSDAAGYHAGSAYVFVRAGTTWSQQQQLTASDATDDDLFGFGVSLSGETALIGAHNDDVVYQWSGSAYVFVRSGTNWIEQAKLTPSDGSPLGCFGATVSVVGDTAIIGAPGDGEMGYAAGAAYAFVRSGSMWTEQAKLTASDATDDDYFGTGVSLSGDTALIGADDGDGGASNTGSAYVFSRSGTTWSQQAKLIASDGAFGDSFGSEVSLSVNVAMIGANGDDDGGTDSGSAYMFVRGGSEWLESAKLTASDAAVEDAYGYDVALSADTALVGARYDDDGASGSGSAYVYRFDCGFGAGVAANRWSMIGLPCDPGVPNTVEDVFGDNFDPADYRDTWVVYRRDEASDQYVRLALDSPLVQGHAYWIYSTESAVWDVTGTRTAYVESAECDSLDGCFEVPITPPDAPTTHRWNFVGHPGNRTSNWSGVVVLVDGVPYTPGDAETAGYVSKSIHKYTGAVYDAFDDHTPGMIGMLESQEGFWVEALPDSSGHTVKLLIPDGMSLGGPPGPPGMQENVPDETGEWYIRLIAESFNEGLIDRGNVLGQLETSADGHDSHDLTELDPFGEPYLTIVFPHSDWGDEAGDYTSDYHPSMGRIDDEWIFEVRTEDPNREIRLAWEPLRVLASEDPDPGEQRQWTLSDQSGEPLMDTMWLQDLATGELIKAADGGVIADYTFNMDGETVRAFRWYAELTALGGIFADDFESGGTSAWTEVAP